MFDEEGGDQNDLSTDDEDTTGDWLRKDPAKDGTWNIPRILYDSN